MRTGARVQETPAKAVVSAPSTKETCASARSSQRLPKAGEMRGKTHAPGHSSAPVAWEGVQTPFSR